MKKILFGLIAILGLSSCGDNRYNVRVEFPDDSLSGKQAYLVTFDNNDTICHSLIDNNIVDFRGEIEKPAIVRVIVNRNRNGTLVFQNGIIRSE